MNAERLHSIAKAIREDLKSTNAVSLLKQLQTALQNQVNQPQQPQPQQQVSQFRQQLDKSLLEAPSNQFSPAWRQVLEQIGAQHLLGQDLRSRIEEIFARNQITPATANDEIQQIFEELQQLNKAVEQLLAGLTSLKIGSDDLEPGTCELGVLVPRAAVENQLPELGKELEKLQKIFAPFAELATGSRPNFQIRTISSTDFSVFVELAPGAAACIAVAVERTVTLYKQLLEIRRLRQELSEQGLQEDSLVGVDSHANTHMERGINDVVEALVEKFGGQREKGRKNELRTELRLALNQVANRIDHGYNIDVRSEPPEEAAEEDDEQAVTRKHFELIGSAAKQLQFISLTGKPILSLPEPENEPDAKKSK